MGEGTDSQGAVVPEAVTGVTSVTTQAAKPVVDFSKIMDLVTGTLEGDPSKVLKYFSDSPDTLKWYLMLFSLNELVSMRSDLEFMVEARRKVFDKEWLEDQSPAGYDPETALRRVEFVQKRLDTVMEYMRKLMAQNEEAFKEEKGKAQKAVAEMWSTLSEDESHEFMGMFQHIIAKRKKKGVPNGVN